MKNLDIKTDYKNVIYLHFLLPKISIYAWIKENIRKFLSYFNRKEGNLLEKENCRRISILCNTSKIYERIMLKKKILNISVVLGKD